MPCDRQSLDVRMQSWAGLVRFGNWRINHSQYLANDLWEERLIISSDT